MNKSIGGYFELELNNNELYHSDAIALNSGRNAFEYILLANNYQKVYIPFFTCDVLLQPLHRNNIKYEFYSINEKLEPIFDFDKILHNEVFLYTNYFGLKERYVQFLVAHHSNIIIDNAQSFYSFPINNADTFYSPRKYFGLPDGGYVYSKNILENKHDIDTNSINRMSHLIKRIAFNTEDGFNDYKDNEITLDNEPIKKMSNLTSKLIRNIDYKNIAKIRASNYDYLDSFLAHSNQIKLKRNNQIPLVYPFRTKIKNLRDILLSKRIYTASYWPNILEWINQDSFESDLINEIIYLPIDQRYTKLEMHQFIKIILNV